MAIQLLFSSNVRRLGQALAHSLAVERQGSDPFAESLVVVPNPNLAKWLTFELADTHGIAANLRFEYLEEGLRLLLGGREARVLTRDGMRQLIVAELLAHGDEPRLEPFRRYCASSVSKVFDPEDRECARRVWQLGGRLAAAFGEYEFHRREMVDAWLREDSSWLAANQRRTFTPAQMEMEAAQRALYRRVCLPGDGLADRLAKPWLTLPTLASQWEGQAAAGAPQTVHFFGLSQLSRFHCLLLHRLAAAYQLRIYHFNVCTEFWEDMSTTAEDRWRAVRDAAMVEGEEEGEELDLDIENPLLKSWGKAGRETVKLLADLEDSEHAAVPIWLEAPDEEEPTTVLAAVQHLISRRTSRLDNRLPQDRSLQVAGCPGRLREIETVHDSIVGNLLDPATGHPAGLQLTDIAILVPDMAGYKPVIGAVFDGRGNVPYNLVDSSAAEDSVFARGLLGLLDLATGDFSRRAVFELLFNPCFMAAADVDREEVAAWLELADRLGIFHDVDAAHREERGLEASWTFTWEQALRRLRLGWSLDPAEILPDTSPFAEFPAAAVPFIDDDTVGRFSLAIRRLGTALRDLARRQHTCAEWRVAATGLMDAFLAVPEELSGEHQVRKALIRALDALAGGETQPGLGECLERAGAPERFGLALLREFLAEAVGAISSGRGRYLVGGVTIASFLPMRPIPFKIVYIVGLQEGAFPGQPERGSLDLRLVRRRLGDVNRTEANRYLFLENLLAVRQRLYLTYVSRDLAKDEVFFPCSVVKQLFAFLGDFVLSDGEFRQGQIPLRPSDWACIQPEPKSWTDLPAAWTPATRMVGIIERFSGRERDALELRLRDRLALLPPDAPERPILERGLAALARRPPATLTELPVPMAGALPVETAELARFLRDPAAATLRRHLGIRDQTGGEALLAEDEPVRLDYLARYQEVRQAVIDFLVLGDPVATFLGVKERLAVAGRQSLAPVGRFGELQAIALQETVADRLGGDDPFAQIRDHALLREVVFGAARGDLPPSRHLPEVLVPGIMVGERSVDVALSGRLEFFLPARDGVASVVVVTDSTCRTAKLENKEWVPSHHVLEPLAAWCALRLAKADLELGEALDVLVAFRVNKKPLDLKVWRFAPSREEGEVWLRSLLTDYLGGAGCELLPYEILAADAELFAAVRAGGEPMPELPSRIADAVLADGENLHPLRHPPEFLGALDDLAVPADAWERILVRLGPVWRGGQGA